MTAGVQENYKKSKREKTNKVIFKKTAKKIENSMTASIQENYTKIENR